MDCQTEKHIQKKLMKYLRNKLIGAMALLLIVPNINCQNNSEVSQLRDFSGIWKFIPPEAGYDSIYKVIKNDFMIEIVYWIDSKKISTDKFLTIIGFSNNYQEIFKLSDLRNQGQRMCFYKKNTNVPNDSIRYFEEARPSCFASYNGIGMDGFEPSETKNGLNCLYFNFNGRDDERWDQCSHLPNYIVQALMKQNRNDWNKVHQLLPYDYKMVISDKAIIYSQPEIATRMYILKNDVVEIYETQGDWIKIKYYIEKQGKDTGKTIEGWIKKSDVE
jgi:hypothetical protein